MNKLRNGVAPHNVGELKRLLTKGFSAYKVGRWEDALYHYNKASKLNPGDARIWNEIGGCHKNLGEKRKALTAFLRGANCDPNLLEPHYNMGLLAYELGDYVQAEQCYLRALSIEIRHPLVWQSLLCLYAFSHCNNPQFVLSVHKMWAARYMDNLDKGLIYSGKRDWGADKRLRIGYVSSDLRMHAVTNFMNPVLRAHAESADMDVFVYNNWPVRDDVMSQLRDLVGEERWHDIYDIEDSEVCMLILKHEIDILVDLNGLTYGNRLHVFARRPAPIQVTYLGYLSTTGMKAFDYRLTDAFMSPAGVDDYYTETLWRLPIIAPFSPMGNAPDVSPSPFERNGYVTFGSMNNFSKVTNDVIRAWVEILNTATETKLFLVAASSEDPLRRDDIYRLFHELGLLGDVASRLILRDVKPMDQFLEYYHQIDICLDTFPYTGGTTSLHTLWMGVPIITLQGEVEIERSTALYLTRTGYAGWVTHSVGEYVALAIAAATGSDCRDALRAIRTELRERMRASPMLKHRAFGESLEKTYHLMWNLYAEKKHAH